jgi:hypothetical protein
MDRTGSGSYPVPGFGISSVQPSGSTNRVIIREASYLFVA